MPLSHEHYVRQIAALIEDSLPLSAAPASLAAMNCKRRISAMIFSPHPDDECLMGALPLRLARETGARIINVPVTLGSRPERRPARRAELIQACEVLGFEIAWPDLNECASVQPNARVEQRATWNQSVKNVAGLLSEFQPDLVFLPHVNDWNTTHIGVHWLVTDALASLPTECSFITVETEYWRPMDQPTTLVECSADDVVLLMDAMACHAGEIARNPYHLRLPAWMMDSVRRGCEWLSGQGATAQNFTFGVLVAIKMWKQGTWNPMPGIPRFVPKARRDGSTGMGFLIEEFQKIDRAAGPAPCGDFCLSNKKSRTAKGGSVLSKVAVS